MNRKWLNIAGVVVVAGVLLAILKVGPDLTASAGKQEYVLAVFSVLMVIVILLSGAFKRAEPPAPTSPPSRTRETPAEGKSQRSWSGIIFGVLIVAYLVWLVVTGGGAG